MSNPDVEFDKYLTTKLNEHVAIENKKSLAIELTAPNLFWRMQTDCWNFWVCLSNGIAILVESCKGPVLYGGEYWIDVTFSQFFDTKWSLPGYNVFKNPTNRPTITINTKQIVMILEASDT